MELLDLPLPELLDPEPVPELLDLHLPLPSELLDLPTSVSEPFSEPGPDGAPVSEPEPAIFVAAVYMSCKGATLQPLAVHQRTPEPHFKPTMPAPRLDLVFPAFKFPEEIRDDPPLLSELPEEIEEGLPPLSERLLPGSVEVAFFLGITAADFQHPPYPNRLPESPVTTRKDPTLV